MVSNIKKGKKKHLYSIDNFIESALKSKKFPKLNHISASGFRAKMALEDRVLVEDEHIFLDELKKYLA